MFVWRLTTLLLIFCGTSTGFSVFARSPLSLPQSPLPRSFRSTICNPGQPHPMRTLRIPNGGPERAKKQSLGEREGRSCKHRIEIWRQCCCWYKGDWNERKPTSCVLNGRWLERTETHLIHLKWDSVRIVTSKVSLHWKSVLRDLKQVFV